jgi:mono/diheme cytochrome c family protein
MHRRTVATLSSTLVALTLTVNGQPAGRGSAPAPPPAAPQGQPSPVRQAPAARASARTAPTPAVSHQSTNAAATEFAPAAQAAMVQQYCATCHSERGKAGNLVLAGFDPVATANDHPETVEKMIRKLRAGMMPPAGAKRPDDAGIAQLASALEARMDAHAALNPQPGWRPFQRLNRTEYARAIRDLLALDVDVTGLLPADTISQGFDNVADAQTFSTTLMESYLRAASRVTSLAIGDPEAAASETSYRIPKTASQLDRVDGAPFGTRGGVSVMHTFPADGEYVFRMDLMSNACGVLFGGTAANEQIEVSVDGERLALIDIDPKMTEATTGVTLKTSPIHVSAGAHRLTAAFLQRFEGPVIDIIAPIERTLADTQIGVAYGITTLPHLKDFNVVGPYRVTGVSETESRQRIFSCRPTTAAEETTCASSIVKRLAGEAFRGPVSEWDFTDLMKFYEDGRKDKDFEHGIAAALEAILTSPQFLFRLESTPTTVRAGQTYRVADRELATRLSYFLFDAGPDADLLKIAEQGRLKTPVDIQKQVTRLLKDPRAETLSTRFASQWLRLQDVDQMLPDALLYPYYDFNLGQAFRRETELFFDSLVREDHSILDLLTADYTFVNERIARHYGMPNVTGAEYRRVTVPEYRRGILGQGSVLTLTSVADRTSPVMRGKWVMEVLLGSPPPPPPPGVPALDETKGASGGKLLSTRARMEEHRKNPQCTSCHKVIDPLGLALDNFDPTGKWRIKDNEVPIDASGTLYDGTKLAGPTDLRAALLKHKDAFLLSFTENLMTYALGRRVEVADMPAVRKIIRDAAANDYRISAFIQGVVNSAAFQMSTASAETTVASR